ncbi:MAG: alpha-E domain-containing protein [Capsulimonas sp.]|uniref:alpha-E domain-containing protein n=1 Tax=Capsulimonas sp. TaxID=2494211 RepID=UPI003265CA02
MLSREADSMFWIGRYVERADATARIVDVQYHSELEGAFPYAQEGDDPQKALWSSILAITGDDEKFAAQYDDEHTERNVLDYFAFRSTNPNSITSCVRSARENARRVREMMSSEMYEALNIFYLEVTRWNVDKILEASPHRFFSQVKNSSHLFQGITDRTMPNDEPRSFLECGLYLERAEKTARILDVKYHLLQRGQAELNSPLDQHQWTAVLKSVGSFEAFRKAHRLGISPAQVVSFLVLNPNFPSSMCYAIDRAERALRSISGSKGQAPTNRAERLIGRLHADLAFLTTEEILEVGLHDFLEEVQSRCNEIGAAISETYLRY